MSKRRLGPHVVVLHRARNEVHHWTRTGSTVTLSPATLTMKCGCLVTL